MDTRYEADDRLELWLGAPGTSGPIGLAGRAVLLGLLAFWTAGFLRSGLDAEQLGGSFLHLVNLPFHEAGHVLFAPFGQFLMTLGGSLLQVAVPVVCAVVFLTKTRDPFAASAAAWWAGQSLMDLAPYIADARALQLVLLGGHTGAEVEGHDWEYILQTLGWLHRDIAIGRASFGIGAVLMIAALAWGAAVLVRQYPQPEIGVTAPNRQAPVHNGTTPWPAGDGATMSSTRAFVSTFGLALLLASAAAPLLGAQSAISTRSPLAAPAVQKPPAAQPTKPAPAAQPAPQPPLSGRVLDAFSMQPIIDAVVQSGTLRVVTDTSGRFALALPPGEAKVSVSAQGYIPDEVAVTVGAAPITLEVVLLSSAQVKEEVTVSGAAGQATQAAPAMIELSPLQVRTVAGAGENIFKVLQTLPGVNATSDFDSRISVRGGGPDQNLTIMDGVEIHDPYRLFGLASAFNPETVQNFELTAGGFSAKYGDRLSSILVIENRAGTTARKLRGTASVSFTDANVVGEGKMPGPVDGSWLVSARRTYYDLVADRLVDTHLPKFADFQAKGVWEFSPGRTLTLFALTSREKTDAQFTDSATASRLGLTDNAGNDLVSASFITALGKRASSQTIVSWYRYTDALGAAGDLQNDSARSNAPDDSGFARTQLAFSYDLAVRDASVREEASIKASDRHLVETGFETHDLVTSARWELITGRNTSEANGSSARGGIGLPSQLDSNLDSRRVGAWFIDRYRVAKWLTVEPGLRLDWSSVTDETILSPRVSANIALRPNLRLRAATGLFTQSPGYEKLLQSDYFVDLTSPTKMGLTSERAVHLIGAVERDFGHGLTARAEAYYKGYDRLLIGRLETPQETAARVALYDYPPELQSSVPTALQITSFPVNTATGTSYGFDIYVAHRATTATDRFMGWASYAWGRANIDAYGRRYPFDYDRRHAVSAVGTARVTRTLDLGATVRIASGFPYTPVQGLRVAAQEVKDDSGAVIRYVPQYDQNGLLVWTTDPGNVGDLNTGRLPVFARVDMRVTFRPSRWNNRVQFYVEVINVFNRKNTGAYQTTLEYDPTSDKPKITQDASGSLPLLPSFGCRIVF